MDVRSREAELEEDASAGLKPRVKCVYTECTTSRHHWCCPGSFKPFPIMHQSSRLTCDQEGAAPRPGLVGDVTGVLAVALSVQRFDQVAGVVSLVAELPDGEEAGAQLPLVPQEACRVSSQQAAGEAEGPAQSLTDLCERRLHGGGVCWRPTQGPERP